MADDEQRMQEYLHEGTQNEPKLTADALATFDGPQPRRPKEDGSESDLSEIDENLFDELEHRQLVNRPVIAIDEETVGKLGVHRRVRDPAEVQDVRPRKTGKRIRDSTRDEEPASGPNRKSSGARKGLQGERSERVVERPTRILSAEEQRMADLDARIDNALKAKTKRRRKGDDVELEKFQDDMIVSLRDRMIAAAEKDYADVKAGHAATHKIRMLNEVRSVITKPNLHVSCMDNNFLVAVKRWLEPLENKSLPAYSIQKELFRYLGSFVVSNPSLLRESGIGKIVAFYTKDVRPQPDIKRQANILIRDWTRPVLGTSDDYSTREYATRDYDPSQSMARDSQRLEEAENDPLAPPQRNTNRTRMPGMPKTYDIVPKSTISVGSLRPAHNMGADDLVKRVKARAMAAKKGGRRSGLSIEGRGLY
ncbi:hypothetical protein DFH27DRAFT_500860 [Peziza echinospora]|nr:hypothetical protein DFH27DRAFT_500860 [Peziza echinospora]